MRKILAQIPLLVVESRTDVEDTQELLGKCREYLLACLVELKRRDVSKDDPTRNCVLAAYVDPPPPDVCIQCVRPSGHFTNLFIPCPTM
jgi:hypothetical protein